MAYAGNIYEKKRQLNMFYINDYGGFWIELLPLLIRSNNIVKIYDYNKLISGSGIKIEKLQKKTGIDNHQLKKGDIIVEFNGSPVTSIDSLQRFLDEDTIGKRVPLGILRKGFKKVLEVVPGELAE